MELQCPAMIMVKEVMILFLVTGLGQKDVKLSSVYNIIISVGATNTPNIEKIFCK